MADSSSKYKIQLEMDKGSASNVSQSIKDLSKSLEQVSKSVKPLAEQMSQAFSPKTLDTINKMSTTFSNLDRVLDSLTKRMSNLGTNINAVANSQGFKDVNAFTAGTILDAQGRPMNVGGGGDGGGGGLPPSSTAGGGGGTTLGRLEHGIKAQVLAQGAIKAMRLPSDIRAAYVGSELAALRTGRIGVSAALDGRLGEYMLTKDYEMSGADKYRVNSAGITNILEKALTFGVAGGIGSGGNPFAIGGGALIGGAVAAAGYGKATEEARQKVLSEHLNRTQEYKEIINMATDRYRSTSDAERIYGVGGVGDMIDSGSHRFGGEASAEFVKRMAQQGVSLRGMLRTTSDPTIRGHKKKSMDYGVADYIGIEKNLRAGAFLSGQYQGTGFLDPTSSDLAMESLARSGISLAGEGGVVAMQGAAEFANQQRQQMGLLGSASENADFMSRIMGYTGTAQALGTPDTMAAGVGNTAVQMRNRMHRGELASQLKLSRLMGMGLDIGQAIEVNQRMTEGNVDKAQTLTSQFLKEKGKAFDQNAFQAVADTPLELAKQAHAIPGVLGSMTEVERRAAEVAMAGPQLLTGEARQKARDVIEERARTQTTADKLDAAQADLDKKISEMAGKMGDAMIPVMREAAEAFLSGVKRGEKEVAHMENRKSANARIEKNQAEFQKSGGSIVGKMGMGQ